MRSARGKSCRGSAISPLTHEAGRQPPYANSTGTIAAASATAEPPDTLGVIPEGGGVDALDPAMIKIAIARIFRTISALCTLLPARTPRQLIAVSTRSVLTASAGLV